MKPLERADLPEAVRQEIDALSPRVLPLAGALVSTLDGLSPQARGWLMAEFARRVPLDDVSPAAEAVMRLVEFGRYPAMDFAVDELQRQYDLLVALELVEPMHAAIDFMNRLVLIFDRLPCADAEDPAS